LSLPGALPICRARRSGRIRCRARDGARTRATRAAARTRTALRALSWVRILLRGRALRGRPGDRKRGPFVVEGQYTLQTGFPANLRAVFSLPFPTRFPPRVRPERAAARAALRSRPPAPPAPCAQPTEKLFKLPGQA